MTGTEIQTIRLSLGLNPSQFGAALGVAPSSVYRWELAGNKTVRLEQGQLALLLKTRDEIGLRKPAENKSTGEAIAQALLVGGSLFAAYKLLEALFKK